MRRAGVIGIVVAALTLLGAVPAQAVTEHKGEIAAPYADWGGVGWTFGTGHVSATLQGFLASCAADFLVGGSDVRDAFMESPLNGYDAYVVDLGHEVGGAFSVKGPGAENVGPPISTGPLGPPIQLTSYDLDLQFYTDVSHVCADANFLTENDDKCFASKPDPDEATPCIKGYPAEDGHNHGARYVVVVASLNLTGEPVPFTLLAPP